MIAGEPQLLKRIKFVLTGFANRLPASPGNAFKIVAALVNGQGMTRVLDERIEVLILKSLSKGDKVNDVPEVIARQAPRKFQMSRHKRR